LRRWDVRTPACQSEVKLSDSRVVQVYAASNSYVSFDENCCICRTDDRFRGKMAKCRVHSRCRVPQFAVSATHAYFGNEDGGIDEYDLDKLTRTVSAQATAGEILCLATKPGAGLLAAGNKTGSVMIWRV
jgi:hypothetical protein